MIIDHYISRELRDITDQSLLFTCENELEKKATTYPHFFYELRPNDDPVGQPELHAGFFIRLRNHATSA
jgi:hypothetical protein